MLWQEAGGRRCGYNLEKATPSQALTPNPASSLLTRWALPAEEGVTGASSYTRMLLRFVYIHSQTSFLVAGCGKCKTLICAHICAHSVCVCVGGVTIRAHTYTQTTLPTVVMGRGACGVFKINCRIISMWFYYFQEHTQSLQGW